MSLDNISLIDESTNNSDSTLTAPIQDPKLKHIGFLFYASLAYCVFYTICMYRTMNGITFPIMVAGSLLMIYLFLKNYGIKLKTSSIFYAASILLLAVNTFTTNDINIVVFDYIGILLLLITGLVNAACDDKKWGFADYFIIGNCIGWGSFVHWVDMIPKFISYSKQYESNGKNKTVKYVLLGIVIAIPLLVVVLLLLSSADLVFGDMLSSIFDGLTFGDVIGIFFTLLFSFAGCFALLERCIDKLPERSEKDRRKAEPVVAITFCSLLAIVYLLFSVIQVLYLFIGNMQLPENYTYAQYARQGFFQLLAVCILNLFIVLLCTYLFKNNIVLKIILTVISCCTYIMIASSAMRMFMYINVYLLTELRIIVLWGLITLSILLAGICIYIFKHNFPLFRYMTVVVTILFLVLAFSHPQRIVAEFNLSRALESNANPEALYDDPTILKYRVTDFYYLSNLCSDVTPVFEKYEPYLSNLYNNDVPEETFIDLCFYRNPNSISYTKDFRKFNLSRNAMRRYYLKCNPELLDTSKNQSN